MVMYLWDSMLSLCVVLVAACSAADRLPSDPQGAGHGAAATAKVYP